MQVALLNALNATQYRKLMLQAYELAADAFTSTADERAAEPESFWVKRIADSSGLSVAFGAFEGQELVGTVALQFSAKPKTRHKASVIGMYVSPRARGTGAGRALLQAAIGYAQARAGTLQLTLTVTEGNTPAKSLYKSAGFQSYGVEPMAILTPEGYKAKVHMWLSLQPNASAAAYIKR
jgi:ribosomal protein S18 acetylase RimI-like enzyme